MRVQTDLNTGLNRRFSPTSEPECQAFGFRMYWEIAPYRAPTFPLTTQFE